MNDAPRPRTDATLVARLSVLEVEMAVLSRSFEKHMVVSEKLFEKLDERLDRQELAIARLLAGISVVVVLANVLAPYIQRLVGLPS